MIVPLPSPVLGVMSVAEWARTMKEGIEERVRTDDGFLDITPKNGSAPSGSYRVVQDEERRWMSAGDTHHLLDEVSVDFSVELEVEVEGAPDAYIARILEVNCLEFTVHDTTNQDAPREFWPMQTIPTMSS